MPASASRPEPTALARRLARLIRATGPISIAQYMAEANAAYYRDGTPFGAGGDFITAPEISQMFGELVGLWCAAVWQAMGAPEACTLVELGPGRGTMMADARRALGVVPGARDVLRPCLVEISPTLRAEQAGRVADAIWVEHVEQVPDGPLIVIANEFFDALPVGQFVHTAAGWCERLVDATADDRLFAVVDSVPVVSRAPEPIGAVREVGAGRIALASALAQRIVRHGGAALIIDYGGGVAGDTLQAVRRHGKESPFDRPGEADLSAHVDFGALAGAAAAAGACVHGPVSQATLLATLGLHERAARLSARATPEQAAALHGQVARLTDPLGMGSLFRAMAITHPALPVPPGFPA